MIQSLWVNLPVKNLERSRNFFKAIGFQFNERFGENSEASACLEIGSKPDMVMLFVDSTFENFTRHPVSDTRKGTEVLLSIDVASRNEVDMLATKVEQAGGTLFSNPEIIEGWMYGCGFKDVDGHRWNVLFMDMDKMPGDSKPQ